MSKFRRNDYLYKKIYTHCYGSIPADEDGRAYDIHHVDGNYTNNHPANLQAVSIQEHYDIHWKQGNWGACQTIAIRMKISPEEMGRLASLQNKKRVENKTHNFLDGKKSSERQKELAKRGIHNFQGPENNQKMLEKGIHPFQQLLLEGKHPSHKKWICSHCQKTGIGATNAVRWHFDNCKYKI